MKFSLAAALALVALAGTAQAGITIVATPSSAPNAFGSPSWSGYSTNALTALYNGALTNGDRDTDPTGYTGYTDGALLSPSDAMVTSFSMWRGTTNPSAPFNGEYGNRLHFGLHAYGDGVTQFRLDDVQFAMHSSDPDDSLVYTGDLSGLTYNGTTRIGYDWGDDRIRGTGDDIIYNANQVGSLYIDELVYVGIGNALWPTSEGEIDTTAAWMVSQYLSVTGGYTIGSDGGSSTVYVPTPGVATLMGTAGLVVLRRRRA